MRASSLRRVISIATGVLTILVFAALVSEQGADNSPFTSDATGPRGTRAFLELLRSVGYSVRVDSNATEFANPGELVILPYFSSAEVSARVRRSSTRGNNLLLLPLTPTSSEDGTEENSTGQETATSTTLIQNPYSGQELKVSITLNDEGPYKAFSSSAAQIDLFTDPENELVAVSVAQLDKSRVYSIADGSLIQNQHLAKDDNARLLIDLISSLNPKGIVISQALISPNGQSLIRALGPGAEAAWFQMWVFFFVGFGAMSIRFGVPPEARASQQGHRSMVLAIANALRAKGRVQELKDAVRLQFLEREALKHRTSRQNIESNPAKYLEPETSNLLTTVRVTEHPGDLVAIAKKLSDS